MINQEMQKSWEQQLVLIKNFTGASIVFFVQLNDTITTIVASTDSNHTTFRSGVNLPNNVGVIERVKESKSTIVINKDSISTLAQESLEIKTGYSSIIGYPVFHTQNNIWGIIVAMDKNGLSFTKAHLSMISTFEKTISDQINLLQIKGAKQRLISKSQGIKPSAVDYLLESINGVPWRLDLITNEFIYLGSQSERITGYTHNDWPTLQEWSNTIHPEDREWAVNYCGNQTTKGKDHFFEYRLIKKDGSMIWVRDVVKLVVDDNDNPIELSGFIIDITELKEKEKKVSLLNDRLKYILSSTNTILNIVDGQGNIVFHSHKDVKAIDKKCYEHFRGRKSKCEECPRRKPVKSKTTFYYKPLEDTEKTMQITAFPFKGDNGELFMAEVRVDISERVAAEKEIADLKDQLEFSMNAGHIAFLEYDLKEESIKTNTFFEKVTGYKFNNRKINLTWILSRIHSEEIENIQSTFLQNIANSREKIDFEFRFLDAANKYIWLRFSGKVVKFDKDSNPLLVSGIINDISAYKSLLGDLTIERNKSLSASKAKSLFLANMSHEIRTPMNAIIGFSELLSKHIEKPPLNGYLNSIKSSGKILLALINDLLDLEKIEAGKMLLSKEFVDFGRIIQEIEQTFLMVSSEKNVIIRISKPATFPTSINIDSLKIKQILLNLVNNALKFTKEGNVTIQYSFKFDNNSDKGALLFSVIDTGIGISEEKQTTIFEPFIQDKNPNKKEHQGTGLGLSIVQKLIHMMDGTISLVSSENKGSNFSILIPNVQSSKQSYAEQNEEVYNSPRFNKELVLLADDIESNLDILKAFCSDLNLTYELARNGIEVIEKAKSKLPKMIFMDLRMPVLDGYKAIEKIRSNEKLKQIPVIAISASSQSYEVEDIYKAGFNGFIEKPIIVSKLNKELSKYLITNPYNKQEPLRKYIPNEKSSFSENERQELQKKFDQKIIPVWKGLKEILSSEKLNLFSENLKEITQKVKWIELEEYIKQLNIAIQSFDYESIQKLLIKFKNYTNQIKDI
ncbi:PAS domain S-box protein [Labilibacter sediminis]|nr:PAS domain S-box protein [Labilibacter sediminis]